LEYNSTKEEITVEETQKIKVGTFEELVGVAASTRMDHPTSGKVISIKLGTSTITAEPYDRPGSIDVWLEEYGVDVPNYDKLRALIKRLLDDDTPFITSRTHEHKLKWERNLRGMLLDRELAVEIGKILSESFRKMSIFRMTQWLISELRIVGIYATPVEVHSAMMVLEDLACANERGTNLMRIGLPKLALEPPKIVTGIDAILGAHR
jgi:hypothetical protein